MVLPVVLLVVLPGAALPMVLPMKVVAMLLLVPFLSSLALAFSPTAVAFREGGRERGTDRGGYIHIHIYIYIYILFFWPCPNVWDFRFVCLCFWVFFHPKTHLLEPLKKVLFIKS